jgi:hypothetical protein
MTTLAVSKVLASLPDPLEANMIYFVRVGTGFDLYVTDNTGAIAYKSNVVLAGATAISVVDALPGTPDPNVVYLVFPQS